MAWAEVRVVTTRRFGRLGVSIACVHLYLTVQIGVGTARAIILRDACKPHGTLNDRTRNVTA